MKILKYPDPFLNKTVKTVDADGFVDAVNIGKDMIEVLKETKSGIGLAANQVGIDSRIIIVKFNETYNIMINPIILTKNKKIKSDENCLSIPNKFIRVPRYNNIEVEYIDEKLEKKVRNFSNLAAKCVQHEIDHLNGITLQNYEDERSKKGFFEKLLSL